MKQKIIFLICMGLCWVGVNAQNEGGKTSQKVKAESVKSSDSLNEETTSKENEEIEKWKAKVKELESKNKELNSALRAEKREGKSAKYGQRIKQLQQDSSALSDKLATMVEVAELETCKKQNILLNEQQEKDKSTIASLRKELKELQRFRIKWLTQLAESVDEKWLNKLYSTIDVNELEMEFQQYEEFAAVDPKVANARDKLKILLGNSQLFQRVVNAINSEYNAEVVNSLIAPMRTLCDNTKDADIKSDIDNFYWKYS